MDSALDKFIDDLGRQSKFSWLVIAMLTCNVFPPAINEINMVFFAITPPHRCKLPDKNWLWSVNESIPKTAEVEDGCHLYLNPANKSEGIIPCSHGWEFNLTEHEWTVVTQWDLVCSREYLVGLISTIYFAGTLVGGPLFGILSDRYGRRPVVLFCLYSQILIAVASVFIPYLLGYIFLRFLLGVCMQGLLTVSITLNLEMVPSYLRTTVGCIMDAIWSVAMFVIVLVVYLVGDWRKVQLILTLPSIITVSYVWLLPESIRWLIANKKIDEVQKIMEKYLAYDRSCFSVAVKQQMQEIVKTSLTSEETSPNYGFQDLFHSRQLGLISIVNFTWWLSTYLTYCGLAYCIPKYTDNFFISFSITSAAELPLVLVTLYSMNRFGRKISLIIFFLLTCGASLLMVIVEVKGLNQFFLQAAVITGKVFINMVLNTLIVYSNELYPTAIRSTGSGMNGFFAQIGAMIAPPLVLLADKLWTPFAFVVFTASCLTSGLLTILMPETNGKTMPEKLDDVQNLWKKQEKYVESDKHDLEVDNRGFEKLE